MHPLIFSDLITADGTRVPFRMGEAPEPSLLLHTAVSTISAIVMLILAFSLRHVAQPRHRQRAVAEARPVVMAYGVVPQSDAAINEDSAVNLEMSASGPVAIGERVGVTVAMVVSAGPAAIDVDLADANRSSTVEPS